MNQVLFVGDTRILEVSMGVDCSCISVMCKAVAGVPWSEVAADASLVANAADTILVPVLCKCLVCCWVSWWLLLSLLFAWSVYYILRNPPGLLQHAAGK